MRPWRIGNISGGKNGWAAIDPDGPFGDEIVAGYVRSEEDADLLAAAPVMLDALQVLHDKLIEDPLAPGDPFEQELLAIVDAALSRARGQ